MKSDLQLKIYLQPGAKKSEIVGKHGECVKIKVQSQPVDGKANEALINFLSEKFSIAKSSISITAGLKSRFKTICIKNCDEQCGIQIQKILNGEL
ncbi:MAG: YggU family protein [Legionellales bacterium RIFCSPHIGHO2_12_FULL_35_11]|nr:MAG: YggU family protein [Legionellales bacterium RIFCSPHIGHO2_12_FULL_35_11]